MVGGVLSLSPSDIPSIGMFPIPSFEDVLLYLWRTVFDRCSTAKDYTSRVCVDVNIFKDVCLLYMRLRYIISSFLAHLVLI